MCIKGFLKVAFQTYFGKKEHYQSLIIIYLLKNSWELRHLFKRSLGLGVLVKGKLNRSLKKKQVQTTWRYETML